MLFIFFSRLSFYGKLPVALEKREREDGGGGEVSLFLLIFIYSLYEYLFEVPDVLF